MRRIERRYFRRVPTKSKGEAFVPCPNPEFLSEQEAELHRTPVDPCTRLKFNGCHIYEKVGVLHQSGSIA